MFDNVISWKTITEKNAVVQLGNKGQPLPAKNGRTFFNYTRSFDGQASNREIYDGVCQKTVQSFLKGTNGIIMTYGQTGSGKTYTMEGSYIDDEREGVLQMSARDIFQYIETCNETASVHVSVFELYNQEINDLIANESISSLQDPKTRMLVDLSEDIIPDFSSFLYLIDMINQRRKVRCTDMSQNSSRSHLIYKISFHNKSNDQSVDSTLFLVDLAGSDSSLRFVKKVKGGQQKQQNEANYINKR